MELGHLLFTIFSAFFGLAVGSFLNVCIYRIPKGTFSPKNTVIVRSAGSR